MNSSQTYLLYHETQNRRKYPIAKHHTTQKHRDADKSNLLKISFLELHLHQFVCYCCYAKIKLMLYALLNTQSEHDKDPNFRYRYIN